MQQQQQQKKHQHTAYPKVRKEQQQQKSRGKKANTSKIVATLFCLVLHNYKANSIKKQKIK